jgi:hypothetical protein
LDRRRENGRVAAVRKPTEPDPDVVKARRLAGLLTKLADRLEEPRESLKGRIDHTLSEVQAAGGLEPYVDDLLAGARGVIRRVNDAWQGIDAKAVTALDGQRRDKLLAACASAVTILRHGLSNGRSLSPRFERDAVDLAISIYADDVPDHAKLIAANRKLMADLIKAKAKLKGARSVPEASKALFAALNMPSTPETAKRSSRRRRQREREREGGHQVSSGRKPPQRK